MSGKREPNASANAEPAPVNLNVPFFEMSEDMVPIGTGLLYRAGPVEDPDVNLMPGWMKNRQNQDVCHCGNVPVEGYILDMKSYETSFRDQHGEKADMHVMAILLAKPCIGIESNMLGERHREMKPGDTLFVIVTSDLRVWYPIAAHPSLTAYVHMKPMGLKPLVKKPGQSVRQWKRGIRNQPGKGAVVKRSEVGAINIEGLFKLPPPGVSVIDVPVDTEADLPPQFRGDMSKPMPGGQVA